MTPFLAAAAVAGVVLGFLAGKAAAAGPRRKAEAERDDALGELKVLKSKPGKQEFRLERYDLVWYPTVTYSEPEQAILSAAPGVPHCPKCFLPLALEREEWRCRQCGAQHAASLADTVVTDAIVNQALKWFSERHPGYRIPRK